MRVLLACLALIAIAPPAANASALPSKAQVMIVGVAHLVANRDVIKNTWGASALSPVMQSQIREVVARLAAFRPTKVMIEASADNPLYVKRYKDYLAGRYTLSANENDQYGYRLAALSHDSTIYPIDAFNFPFPYESMVAWAQRHGQGGILTAADKATAWFINKDHALERRDLLLDDLIFLNTPEALDANAAWYMYADRVGNARSEYPGADLVSDWYERNLHIFANITHSIKPGDRVVVFIGQGHAAILDPLVRLSPYLQFVDPETYLNPGPKTR
ncbi:MAG: DUF5694 domain-containing protein [Vulcanimicrobiaceae bacterium]